MFHSLLQRMNNVWFLYLTFFHCLLSNPFVQESLCPRSSLRLRFLINTNLQSLTRWPGYVSCFSLFAHSDAYVLWVPRQVYKNFRFLRTFPLSTVCGDTSGKHEPISAFCPKCFCIIMETVGFQKYQNCSVAKSQMSWCLLVKCWVFQAASHKKYFIGTRQVSRDRYRCHTLLKL